MNRTRQYVLVLLGGVCLMLISMTNPVNINSEQLPQTSLELGEKLFHDPILSGDRTLSCASCHKPEFAFSDNVSFSEGTEGKLTKRNTPTVMYMTGKAHFFWDGRAKLLEEQALMPIANPDEMDLPIAKAVKRLKDDAFYIAAFQKVFYTVPSDVLLAKVLADFQRSLVPYSSDYDKYLQGDETAMSKAAIRGLELFIYDGNCIFCHLQPHFGGDEFFNIGLFDGKERTDEGRFEVTGDSIDLGGFETSHLRNIEVTAPYMHDGSFKTLREVLEFYNNPDDFIDSSVPRDSIMTPLDLTRKELNDLEAFLLSLTDEEFQSKK